MIISLWAVESIAAIIIEDEKSPIIYSNQTNGTSCSHPEAKGYLVPVEFKGRIITKFMSCKYACGCGLDASFYDDSPEIMQQLNDYFCEDYTFELDEDRRNKNTESWIYLTAKRNASEEKSYGILGGFPETFKAVLTWPNSD